MFLVQPLHILPSLQLCCLGYSLKVQLSCGDQTDYILETIGCYDICPQGECVLPEEDKEPVKKPTTTTKPVSKVTEYQFKKAVIDTKTTYSLEEVKVQKRNCDYVFLSPVFDSISKLNYHSNYTPEEIRKAHKEGIIDKKVIALGGIDQENIKQVKEYGFGRAAILGALWNKFDTCLDRDYTLLIEHFKKLKKLAD